MSVTLAGSEGELVLVRIAVEPHLLEEMLDALALLPFPVNPEIRHHNPATLVEFPAYSRWVDDVRHLLETRRLEGTRLDVVSMLVAIQS